MKKHIQLLAAACLVALTSSVACAHAPEKPTGESPVEAVTPSEATSSAQADTAPRAEIQTDAADSAAPATPAVPAAGPEETFPFSPSSIREHVVNSYGNRCIRLEPDESFSLGAQNKKNCFIIMSKKDYYLYVYEKRGSDSVLVARYDCCFALKKGDKTRQGDMRTPHCKPAIPTFSISEIKNASSWRHDFHDGRGNIKAYGAYFLRLNIGTSNRSIGIHGSTNNANSVPGRASEGCIRLRDKDIIDLTQNYAFTGMKVIIKNETEDDRPFEIRAMRKLGKERLRHLDPSTVLTNDAIQRARTENFRN